MLDTEQLLAKLQANAGPHCYRQQVDASQLRLLDNQVSVDLGDAEVQAARLVLTAGAGNETLLRGLALAEPRMQRRPLQQVLVQHPHLKPLHAHCLTGVRRAEPRLTITSHADGDRWLWYLGGQLATDGVARTAAAQIDHARRELALCVPWLNWDAAQLDTLCIDRAEPLQQDGQRPDEAFVHAQGPVIVGWPTKLSLVPDLGDRVLAAMPAPAGHPQPPALSLPVAGVARPRWLHDA